MYKQCLRASEVRVKSHFQVDALKSLSHEAKGDANARRIDVGTLSEVDTTEVGHLELEIRVQRPQNMALVAVFGPPHPVPGVEVASSDLNSPVSSSRLSPESTLGLATSRFHLFSPKKDSF